MEDLIKLDVGILKPSVKKPDAESMSNMYVNQLPNKLAGLLTGLSIL
ncbi:hypothetical protein [Escherichia phage C6]|nr:hypothetical protein [Escherichia phage C6]